MKPREYIIKYKLDTIHGANNFNHVVIMICLLK